MKKMFMIQNEGFVLHKDFLVNLSKWTGIPEKILEENYKDENQIMINEHYFKNLYNYFYKEIEYEFLLQLLKEQNNTHPIFRKTESFLEIFLYEVF